MQIIQNATASRFEVRQGDDLACLVYRQHGNAFMIMHTEVPKNMSGQSIGSQLIKAALNFAKTENFHVIVYCPFVKSYLKKHPSLKKGVRVMMAK